MTSCGSYHPLLSHILHFSSRYIRLFTVPVINLETPRYILKPFYSHRSFPRFSYKCGAAPFPLYLTLERGVARSKKQKLLSLSLPPLSFHLDQTLVTF